MSSISSTFSLLATSALVYVFTRAIYDVLFHPLAKVPGPFLAKLGCFWKLRAATSLQFADRLQAAHDKYGSVVRIATNEVSVISPDDVRTIYGHKSNFTKGPWYDAWRVGPVNSHFNERDAATHADRRRLVASAYSLNHLRTLEPTVDQNIEILIKKHLEPAATAAAGGQDDKKGGIVDLAKLITWYCYDTVTDISWGKTYGLLETGGQGMQLVEDLAAGTILVSSLACTPIGWLLATDLAQRLLAYMQPDVGISLFMKQAYKIVNDRIALKANDPAAYEQTRDMLHRFTECIDSSVTSQDTFELIVNETMVVVVAGADTTLATTNAALRYIYGKPTVLAKLRAEIIEANTLGKLSLPSPTYDEVAILPYLNACIKEAGRLHPAVCQPLQRVVPEHSSENNGTGSSSRGKVVGDGKYYLPPGTLIGTSAWTFHKNKLAFGEDASEYRPERWLGDDRLELEKYNMTFGMGSRVCIGRHISMMEMNKLLPVIVHNYDIEILNPAKPYNVKQCWFTIQNDFMVKISKRAEIDH